MSRPGEAEAIADCRYCGRPKPINTWCASDECAERVAAAQDELNRLTSSSLRSFRGAGATEGKPE